MAPIYLDYNASTPIDPAVAAAMRPFLAEHFGNPSSGHWAARAREGRPGEGARPGRGAARLRSPTRVVFTSGGSEANNLALKGVYFARRDSGDHIVTTPIEHPAILATVPVPRAARRAGHLPAGRLDPAASIPTTCAAPSRRARSSISIMHANNEVGTIQPIAEMRAHRARAWRPLAHRRRAVGRQDPDRRRTSSASICSRSPGTSSTRPRASARSTSAGGSRLEPLIHGAGHESGRRAGTESALLAVGLGKACELARDLSSMDRVRACAIGSGVELQARFGDRVVLNGHPEHRLPNTLNVSFVGRVGAEILERMDGVAASTGSACHSGRIELSPVLEAMGVAPEVGMGAIRFSLGRGTTRDEIDASCRAAERYSLICLKRLPAGTSN